MNVTRWNGQPITQPGVYAGVPIVDYHHNAALCAGPSISSSGLRTIFAASPAHYWLTSPLNPKRAEPKETEAMILGRAAHHLLLGEAQFRKHFTVRPADLNGKPWHGNRTDCKEWLAAVRAEGLTVLTEAEVEQIRGMAEGLSAHPLVKAGMLNGLVEHSLVWKDEETGVWIKARPDVVPTADLDFADLKTAADVSDDALERSVGDYGWHVQGAVVGMACRAVLKREMASFSLVCTEKTPPNIARVKTLKLTDLELGERQVRAALRILARCIEQGRWPGPGGEETDAEFIELKPFHRERIERRLAYLEQAA